MKKNIFRLFVLVMIATMAASAAYAHDRAQFNWSYKIKNGTIITKVPKRPQGQKDAIKLTVPKIKVVRVGFAGLGWRGTGAVNRWCQINGIEIKALCDYEQQRADAANNNILKPMSMPPADTYYGEYGYKDMCRRNDIDLIYIATDWEHHFEIAKCALENGKNVAIEVPSLMDLTQIWELINLAESKRLHCTLLENCCYDFFELNTLNMAQKGVFGEVLHVQGAYLHNLDENWDTYWRKDKDDLLGWRLRYNQNFRGDIYPTHGLGPIAQLLNIHRGDRMATLVAMDTKAVNGPKWVEKYTGKPCTEFRNGEHTTTLIRTENDKVIEIQHNTLSPQPYSRMYQLTGTKGFANKYPIEGYCLNKEQMTMTGVSAPGYHAGHEFLPTDAKNQLVNKYRSPIVARNEERARKVGGHGGMDYIMDVRLVYCLQHGLPLDIDVYDMAEWSSLAELGSISMDHGNMPVQIPDFTRGHWNEVKGFSHAFAPQAEEEQVDKASEEFTRQLKAKGAEAWKKLENK